MKSKIGIILILMLASACGKQVTKVDLRGSWYFSNDYLGYSEICLTDSTIYLTAGIHSENKYYIKDDSIFFHQYDGETKSYKYVAMSKIVLFENDTLRLTSNQNGQSDFEKGIFNEFWIRFPKDEFGECDLDWEAENSDSVSYKFRNDYDRRRAKYLAIKTNTISKYDSLVRAGYWYWDMKKVAEDKTERIKELEKRLQELEASQNKR